MLMLDLNETIDQCWYGHVLRNEDSHVLSRVLKFEVFGQRKKVRLNRTWMKQFEEDSIDWFEQR